MAKVLVKVNVAYPDELDAALKGFNRRPYGELRYAADQDEAIHNHIYITFNWESVEKAKAFWASDIGQKHVASWRSVSKPEFVYLRTLPGERAT